MHERASDDGALERTWLEVENGSLRLRFDDSASAPVGPEVLDAVMKRYGKPLADDIVAEGPTLELAEGRTLTLFRHRARYDVIARDFLVYGCAGAEPLAELASAVTAALSFLVRSRRD